MTLSSRRYWLLAALLSCARAAATPDNTLEEVVVTSSLSGTHAADLAQSVTVLGRDSLSELGVQHFQDVLGAIPDLNWAAGTSRPRFFQLRGIGEVEQYQGAPNPSVGFLIDDIDFSGVGMPATLFDTQQIEVLRGPQGASYGANALAGLISVRTVEPGQDFELRGEVTGATYNTRSGGVVVGDGFASGDGGWRVVAQKYASDGFRHDAFLNRYDTNGYDETTLRARIRWQLSPAWRADLTLMHADLDNGYDGWSIYNTYTTYSNQPGRDSQRSNGAALKFDGTLDAIGRLVSITSVADSSIVYSFDGDWGNDTLWGSSAPYDYFQSDRRTRRTVAQDLRLIGDPGRALFGRVNWLAGVYALHLTESDKLRYVYDDQYYGAGESGLDSEYSAQNVALYGSLDTPFGEHANLSGGIRVEQRVAKYSDSADVASPFGDLTNRMLGGNVSLARTTRGGDHIYATASRGYKGGGFNIGAEILAEQRSYGPESLWSIEAGYKHAQPGGRLELQSDVFYMRRQHMQVYLSEQLQQNNPLAYVFFTQTASDGENLGWEGEGRYQLSERWQLTAAASLLSTRYLHVTGLFGDLGIGGRAQPFAPGYKVSAGLEYRDPSGWYARLDSSALDSFYYYTSDAQTSRSYHIENVRVGYQRGAFTASLWVRNLFSERYAQQGFYFGLIPPNFPNQSFLQLGDPRQVGVTVSDAVGRHSG